MNKLYQLLNQMLQKRNITGSINKIIEENNLKIVAQKE